MSEIHYLDAKGPEGMLVCAVGDVHGRLDLLEAMIERIEALATELRAGAMRIVLLGDYVDRGPNPKGVLDLLLHYRADPRFVLLGGNHDFGFADFLSAPRAASLFARFGGKQTLASYGIDADFSSDALARTARNALMDIVPPEHLYLLDDLKRSATFGDFFFCHAGIRPGIALDRQDQEDLIWIREEFLNYPGLHPKVIVHGHTPHFEPEVLSNRVNVDTRAYDSGVLSALAIFGEEKQLLSVEAR